MAKSQQERKDWINEHQKEQRRKGRDIGGIPPVAHPDIREACRLDLKLFCETYYPAVFNLGWSPDHLRVIELAQTAVIDGGLFAVAMPRGSGKTSIALAATVWALLYGHRSFVALVATSAERSYELLHTIKTELDTNDHLYADFPEVCYPIRCIEGRPNNTAGQLLEGERTRIEWTQKHITLPTVPGSCSSGSVVKVAGITGGVRGMQVKRATDGATIRPDLVIIDDPQDDESANSPPQVSKRIKTISGAILGLAGPGEKIAGIMPCTVIAKDDLADRLLDRKKHPEWQGERIRMLKSLPTDAKLWEQYAELHAQSLRKLGNTSEATAFYKANQKLMDAGAEASWAERFNSDEISAIQNAMNLRLQDEAAFQAEYQNDPITAEEETALEITTDGVLAKASKTLARGVVPDDTTKLTAFIDVQGTKGGVLYYCVVAFNPDFTAHVVDYGTYPEQGVNYFALRDVKKTLARRGQSIEAAITKGLQDKSTDILETDWQRQNGETIRVSRLIIDAGYQSDVIRAFIKTSKHRALMLPSFGRAHNRIPMNEWTAKPGERHGWNWRVRPDGHALIEVNEWKTFIAQRLASDNGDVGCLTIYKSPAKSQATQHKMFAEHLSAERPVHKPDDFGRLTTIWSARHLRENHFFDCLVGCYAAASEQGVLFTGHRIKSGQRKRIRKKLEVNW